MAHTGVTTLDRLKTGETGTVIQLNNESGLKRRLMDMGLVQGTRIECRQISPLGDPVAYLIRGTVIALRREDASKIEIVLQ